MSAFGRSLSQGRSSLKRSARGEQKAKPSAAPQQIQVSPASEALNPEVTPAPPTAFTINTRRVTAIAAARDQGRNPYKPTKVETTANKKRPAAVKNAQTGTVVIALGSSRTKCVADRTASLGGNS